MGDEVLSRERELEVAQDFVRQVALGPAALLVEGEAGIGKTTVWRASCALAEQEGYRILMARPAQPDERLSFVGLSDLLMEIEPERFAALPKPQRLALDAALLRGQGPAPDQRAVFTAVLSLMVALAAEKPVVLAVDDLQWLDPPSARALGFVARRTRTHPVGLLLASRASETGNAAHVLAAMDRGWTRRVQLGPLTLAATQRLLKRRLERGFSRPTLRRIQDSSAGNPFFALELARALGTAEPGPGEPLPAPQDVRQLVRDRIERLPAATRRGLLRMAALSQPTAALLGTSVSAAREDGLVAELEDGRLVFTHPLYASAVYGAASAEDRQRAHRYLATKVGDLEEQARHLALAATGPHERVATTLDRAAEQARNRGAPEMAAQLSELAVKLTPDDEDTARRRRTLDAADAHIQSGAMARVRELLEPLLEELPAGDERADVLIRLGDIGRDWQQMDALAERALSEAVSDAVRSRSHVALAWARWPFRDIDFALRHCRLALRHAERTGEPRLLVPTLASLGFFELMAGRATEGLLERAIELRNTADGDGYPGGLADPRLTLALRRLYQGRVDEARASILELVEETAAGGDEPVLVLLRFSLTHVELLSGRWKSAAQAAGAAYEAAEQIGPSEFGGMANFWKALVAAHLGHEGEARAAGGGGSSPGPKLESAGFRSDEPRGPRLRRALARPGPRCPSALPPDARLGVGTKSGHCDASASRVRLSDRRLGRRGQTRRGGIRGRAAREGSTKAEESDCTRPRKPLRWPAPCGSR